MSDSMLDCTCPRFKDTNGYRIGDLTCPVHGVSGPRPLDGPWEDMETGIKIGKRSRG
jgi:hypothetical protein